MSEREFTDNEIIKALECCQTKYNRNCEECPYKNLRKTYISIVTCESEMRKDLLAFIRRQKSEVARAIFKQLYRKLEYYQKYRDVNDIINNLFIFIEEVEKEYTS